jgi:hypothetical protein
MSFLEASVGNSTYPISFNDRRDEARKRQPPSLSLSVPRFAYLFQGKACRLRPTILLFLELSFFISLGVFGFFFSFMGLRSKALHFFPSLDDAHRRTGHSYFSRFYLSSWANFGALRDEKGYSFAGSTRLLEPAPPSLFFLYIYTGKWVPPFPRLEQRHTL